MDIGRRQTLEHLSPEKRALLERRLAAMGLLPAQLSPIPARDRLHPCPLSFPQQRLWLLEQLAPDTCVYNMPAAVRLRGALDVDALRRALDGVVARHDVLRTTFQAAGEAPVQIVGSPSPVALPLLDLTPTSAADRQAALDRTLAAEVRRPFDLTRDLMLRAHLVRLGDRDHVLVLTVHHLACDGRSMGILAAEVAEFYAASVEGRPPNLPPLPIQYGDYAAWQRQWLQGRELARQMGFWTSHLRGAPAAIDLPTDRARPAVPSFMGGVESLTLPRPLAGALKELSRSLGATLPMTLLAGFYALLHRYSQQDDLVVGVAVAGRRRVETEPLIGFFVNTLLLRADLSGDPRFQDLLERVRTAMVHAYDHQDLPPELLAEALHPERSVSRMSLAQVLFIFQDTDQSITLDLPGLVVNSIEVNTGTAKMELTLLITDRAQGLCIEAEYSRDLFEPATIRRMLRHYAALLEGAVAAPGDRLSRLDGLGAAQSPGAAGARSAADDDRAPISCVHHLFEMRAAASPDVVALTCGNAALTYAELNQRANRLAHYLRRHGVGPEVLVGLCLERSADMIVAVLGVLKAGGAYLPLDPEDPVDRLAFMMADARIPLLITQRRFLRAVGGFQGRVVCLDADAALIDAEETGNPPHRVVPPHLCYVVYTSGSTGRPKGVLLTHAGLANLMAWRQGTFPMGAGDVILQKTPLTFDASVDEIFPPLLSGARLAVARPGGHRDTEYLVETIRAERVTHLEIVPALLAALAEEPGLETCASLRRVFSGGEVLTRAVTERLRSRLKVEVVNTYGPTETTVDAAYFVARPPVTSATVPIGRPILNTRLYILDPHMRPVPPGVPGELYIGGPGLARGYLGQPALTAERFVPDPLSRTPGARLYRTGDRVRQLPDGAIEYLGRLDFQVKLRGFRIELGEIEQALRAHPDVRDAAVTLVGNAESDRRLVAYFVPALRASATEAQLRSFLQQTLPDYMVPAVLISLPELPLTPTGKVDRNKLPQPGDPGRGAAREVLGPADPLECLLQQVWEETLDVRPVGINDNFFDLGGHSLLAVQLLHRIQAATGRRLPLAALFTGATIGHLAQALRQQPVADAPITTFHPRGARPPFFFLHGDFTGGGFYCRRLAASLGSDQPVIVLHPHGVDGGPIPTTIEAMATDHLALIRAIQPRGPYRLGGHCNGGLIAFETARRLRAEGEEVALLAVLDASAENARLRIRLLRLLVEGLGFLGRFSREQRLDLFVRARRHALEFAREHPAAALLHLGRLMRPRRPAMPGESNHVGDQTASAESASRRTALAVYARAVALYVPGRYGGAVALFRSRASTGVLRDLGWRRVARRVQILDVPGDHLTSVVRHVEVLGAQLRACLAALPAAAPPWNADRWTDRPLG